jgi:TonB family protein
MKFLANFPHALAPKPVSANDRRRFLYRLAALSLLALPLTLAAPNPLSAQEPPSTQPADPQPAQATQPQALATPAPAPAPDATPALDHSQSGEVTEDELKQALVGKQLFLRGGYLGDSINFNEHGLPVGHPAIGSYALSGVEIEKVRLTKHKVELVGARYALHFLGALPYEDPSKAVDRVKITPKKKVLKISIDREQLVKEKKSKEDKKSGRAPKPSKGGESPAQLAKEEVASSETDVAQPAPATAAPSAAPAQPAPTQSAQATPEAAAAPEAADQPADQASDQASVTSTTSPMHAAKMLREALDHIFAQGLDDKVKAQMPPFWQLYYQAQAAGVDYRPRDPSVLRSSAVDSQAKVLSSIAPDSNEFAQASGIAGRALYRAVIGSDGKPGEIAVVRPIGFGLDEKAVEAIRKATFQPALKAGQPVAETLDLAVLFRIYSKRTSVAASADGKPAEPIKPGPFTVQAQKQQQQ